MEVKFMEPPREFKVGVQDSIILKDCARITLESDEQVTFKTKKGAEYDVCRKSWGFYATPSLNRRLKNYGLRGVLIRNRKHCYYVLLVEEGLMEDFNLYLAKEQLTIVCWLDKTVNLKKVEENTGG